MNSFIRISLLISCIFVSSMQAVIGSLHVYKNDITGTELCLIGDIDDVDKFVDNMHKKILFHFIDKWAHDNQETLFLLEANDFSVAKIKKDLKQTSLTLGNSFMQIDLPVLANTYPDKKNNNLCFRFSDIRDKGIFSLSCLYNIFNSSIPLMTEKIYGQKLNDITALQRAFDQDRKWKNKFFTNQNIQFITSRVNRFSSRVSANIILQEIDLVLDRISNYMKKLKPTSLQKKHFSKFYEKITKNRQAIEKFFRTHLTSLKEPGTSAFLKNIEKEKSFTPMIESPLISFILDVAHAGFLIDILNKQQQFKRIVLFAGSPHIANLQCLKQMGYKPIEKDIMPELKTCLTAFNNKALTCTSLYQTLSAVFNTAKMPSIAQESTSTSVDKQNLNTVVLKPLLFEAAKEGNLESVEYALDHGAHINSINKYGFTPLCIAIYFDHSSIVKRLLKDKKINVNQTRQKNGRTPLYFAAYKGNAQIMKHLLSRDDIDVNKSDTHGLTPLCVAANSKHVNVVQLLLQDKRTDVNKTSGKYCPLHAAVQSNYIPIIALLLAHPDIQINNKDSGGTALGLATKWGHKEAVAILLDHKDIDIFDWDNKGTSILTIARKQHRDIKALFSNKIIKQRALKKLTAPFKMCASSTCIKQEEKCGDFWCCSLCKQAPYCSTECQRNHWPIHKHYCKKKISINEETGTSLPQSTDKACYERTIA